MIPSVLSNQNFSFSVVVDGSVVVVVVVGKVVASVGFGVVGLNGVLVHFGVLLVSGGLVTSHGNQTVIFNKNVFKIQPYVSFNTAIYSSK